MDRDICKELGAIEVHDLGLQVVEYADGPALAYVTVAFLRCSKCGKLAEVRSALTRRWLLDTGLDVATQVPAARLGHDRGIIEASREAHARRCIPRSFDMAPMTATQDAERK